MNSKNHDHNLVAKVSRKIAASNKIDENLTEPIKVARGLAAKWQDIARLAGAAKLYVTPGNDLDLLRHFGTQDHDILVERREPLDIVPDEKRVREVCSIWVTEYLAPLANSIRNADGRSKVAKVKLSENTQMLNRAAIDEVGEVFRSIVRRPLDAKTIASAIDRLVVIRMSLNRKRTAMGTYFELVESLAHRMHAKYCAIRHARTKELQRSERQAREALAESDPMVESQPAPSAPRSPTSARGSLEITKDSEGNEVLLEGVGKKVGKVNAGTLVCFALQYLLTHERGKPINVCKLYNEARDMREAVKAACRTAPSETSFEHGMSRKPAKTRSPSNRPRLTEDKAFRSMRQQILKSFFREHRDSYKFWFDWDTAQRTVKVRIAD